MSLSDVRYLVFIDDIMDKCFQLNILKKNLKMSAEKMGNLNTFKFYPDNHSK